MVLHVGVLHCDSEQRVHNPENRFLSNTPLRLLLDNLPFSLNCSGKFPLDVTQNLPVRHLCVLLSSHGVFEKLSTGVNANVLTPVNWSHVLS